jgi:hypothetical protein
MGQVRAEKGCDRARGTHNLETALGGTTQDKERKRLSEWHSLSRDRIVRDKSGHGRSASEWHSQPKDRIVGDKSEHRKHATK